MCSFFSHFSPGSVMWPFVARASMALVWRYAAKDKEFPTPFWSVTLTLAALGTKTFTQAPAVGLGAMVRATGKMCLLSTERWPE